MDPKRFDGLKSQIARSLSLEQCIELETVIGRILSERAGEAAITKKAGQIAESGTCPRCGCTKVTKHGRDARGVQRFRCSPTSGCGKIFNPLTGTPLARMRKSHAWMAYARGMTRLLSLDDMVVHVPEISRVTAWRWRYRFLELMASRQAETIGGIVEVDETHFLRAFKGHRGWKRGKAPENRPPRYRGEGALLRGLSGQQVPVLTAIDRAGRRVEEVLPSRTAGAIGSVLNHRIEPKTILCTDGLAAYRSVASATGAEHRVIQFQQPSPVQKAIGLPPRTSGVLTLGRVNGVHARMKAIINHRFRGVSTHRLPLYMGWIRQHDADATNAIAFIETAIRSHN
ncbi:MAG: IS1595 family transposase [Rhodospirillales bacterium]